MNPDTPAPSETPDTTAPEPGRPSPRAAALATEMLAVRARAAFQLRWIRILLGVSAVCWGSAVLLWLPGGGRAALAAGAAPSAAAIVLPAWIAVAGLLTAVVAATFFMLRAMNSSLESIVERHYTQTPKGRRP